MGQVANALNALRKIRDSGQTEIIVSYSGGKDSLVALDLCARVFDRVHPFFWYLVKGLECEERGLRFAEKRWNVTVTRLPGPILQSYLGTGVYVARKERFRRRLNFSDMAAIMRDRTGCRFVASGHRMDESPQRRGMMHRYRECGGIDWEHGKVYPVHDWNYKSIFAYLRHRKIPVPDQFALAKASGVTLYTASLAYLKRYYPDDYKKVATMFPEAEYKLHREALCVQHGESTAKAGLKSDDLRATLAEFNLPLQRAASH